MKHIITLLICALSFQILGQSYTAIHVIGEIYVPSKQSFLKRGDRIAESEVLEFSTANAKAAMLSTSRGRYVVQASKSAEQQDKLSFVLSSVITPARGQMSTRSGSINNQLDFEKRFGSNKIAWLKDSFRCAVSATAYPINENQFFYISYKYNGEQINKKLSGDGPNIIFSKSELYQIDDSPIDPGETSEAELYYYDMSQETAEKLTDLNLIIVSREELSSIAEAIGDTSEAEKIAAVYEYINSLYGIVGEEEVRLALQNL